MTAFNRRSFLDAPGTFSATALLTPLSRPAWSRNLQKALMQAEHRPPGDLHQLIAATGEFAKTKT